MMCLRLERVFRIRRMKGRSSSSSSVMILAAMILSNNALVGIVREG